jgi:hypothetical protein
MKLSFITPTAYIKDYQSRGDFILALSHLLNRVEPNKYEQEILATKLPIILDNGLFENHFPEGIDSLIEKALRVGATHFFAPDHLYNAKKTLRSLENALYIRNNLKIEDRVKVGAVVQGETEEEFFWLYDKFQRMPGVDLIVLSILAIPRCFGRWNKTKHTKKESYVLDEREITPSRIEMIEKMIKRGGNRKKCHLLGLGDSYKDVVRAGKCDWIVSNDSSSCFWNAMQGKAILDDGDVEGGKTKIKVAFDFDSATQEQLHLALYNINKVKKLCLK